MAFYVVVAQHVVKTLRRGYAPVETAHVIEPCLAHIAHGFYPARVQGAEIPYQVGAPVAAPDNAYIMRTFSHFPFTVSSCFDFLLSVTCSIMAGMVFSRIAVSK